MTEAERRLRGYLLGELSAAEQAALEEQYFGDPQLFDQIVAVENNLVDQYARGLLSGDVRRQFEAHYLASPRRRERAEFAVALAGKIRQSAKPAPVVKSASWVTGLFSFRNPKLAWAVSFALPILLGTVVWLSVQTRRLHQELAHNEAERAAREQREHELQRQIATEQQRAQELTAELERLRALQPEPSPSPGSAPSFVTLALTIAGVRSGQSGPPPTLVVPSQTEQVRLQVSLPESDYANYRATLNSADGKEVFAWRQVSPRATKSAVHLTLPAPARAFAAGDYLLTLDGVRANGEVEAVSQSRFRVERK